MQTVIALLGRKDQPTDAVEEYCTYLSAALRAHDIEMEIRRVPWEIHGWAAALETLPLIAGQWRDKWVFVQYTALAWSARGFPHKFLRVLGILKTAGARIAVVFHDAQPFHGKRLVDKFRRYAQTRIMRHALASAERSIFTIPLDKISWLPPDTQNAIFIPVGPNLPVPNGDSEPRHSTTEIPTIAVFSITGGDAGSRETKVIIDAVRAAAQQLGRLRLSVFGRHAELRESDLVRGLQDLPLELSVQGVLDAEAVVQRLRTSDVLLFIRGPISSGRGSAIAGIACGLPLIAYSGSQAAPPITEAGVILVPEDDLAQLSAALIRVLSDSDYRLTLAERSRSTYEAHFSWSVIASHHVSLMNSK
jgi:glycosyltransferase involved in cell wall biosynthesis